MAQLGKRSLWAVLTEWRNWRLPIKVGAIILVPAIAALILGVVQIRDKVSAANSYAGIQQVVALRSSLIPLIEDIQQERWLAAEELGGGLNVDPGTFHQQAAKVDAAARDFAALANGGLDYGAVLQARYAQFRALLAQLGGVRELVLSGRAEVDAVINDYSEIIGVVEVFDQGLINRLNDFTLNSEGIALYTTEVSHEQVRQEEALVSVGLARNRLTPAELAAVQAADVRLSDAQTEFQSAAAFEPVLLAASHRTVPAAALAQREQYAQAVVTNGLRALANGDGGNLGVSSADWTRASDTVATALATETQELDNTMAAGAAAQQDSTSNAAGSESVVLFVGLLLAGFVGVLFGRQLLRSVGVLRRDALEVANRRLPAAVAAIDEGATDVAIEPVPVHTREELGQLARAFDAVHTQAVRSAIGQAQLRSNLRNVFVNLSRRSQGLVERQLRLMERLERNEDSPEQLANLFKLDHLATRMRRNNENLMVLSGDDPTQRSGRPLALPDVMRAAVSEIEHYQRVVVRTTPSVEILGYAANDLVRLIAELLDNATNFSPPETQVVVSAAALPGSGAIRIEIRDQGIGMADTELREANERLGIGAGHDIPVSRQMGLYVAGRLARRHNVHVELEPDPESGGLLAVVVLPPDLVHDATGPSRVVPAAGMDTGMAPGGMAPGTTAGTLGAAPVNGTSFDLDSVGGGGFQPAGGYQPGDTFDPAEFNSESFSVESFNVDSFGADSFNSDSFGDNSFNDNSFNDNSFNDNSFSADSFGDNSFSADSFTPTNGAANGTALSLPGERPADDPDAANAEETTALLPAIQDGPSAVETTDEWTAFRGQDIATRETDTHDIPGRDVARHELAGQDAAAPQDAEQDSMRLEPPELPKRKTARQAGFDAVADTFDAIRPPDDVNNEPGFGWFMEDEPMPDAARNRRVVPPAPPERQPEPVPEPLPEPQSEPAPVPQAAAPAPHDGEGPALTAAGLPRRVPRARMAATLRRSPSESSAAPSPSGPTSTGAHRAANRDAGKVRGFLSEYQAGVQKGGKHSRSDEPDDNAFGQEA